MGHFIAQRSFDNLASLILFQRLLNYVSITRKSFGEMRTCLFLTACLKSKRSLPWPGFLDAAFVCKSFRDALFLRICVFMRSSCSSEEMDLMDLIDPRRLKTPDSFGTG